MARTVPELLALAKGTPCTGQVACFYCGGACDGTYTTAEYVKESFNARTGVRRPGSTAVCHGCVIAMDQQADVTLIDGEFRPGQKSQLYSWVITTDRVVAATKAHLHLLRPIFLSPPEPPFAFVLTNSGQKQLLYRGVVNHDRSEVVCTLEEQVIRYRPWELAERFHLCGKLIAATGKPGLAEPVGARFGMAVLERFPATGEQLITKWQRVREEPVSRLAAWLSANKETCDGQYPAEGGSALDRLPGVPAKDSRAARPGDAARGSGGPGDAGAVGQLGLFDGPPVRRRARSAHALGED